MPIWRGTEAVPTVGPEFHLKYTSLGGGDSYKQDVSEAPGLAHMMLRQIMSVTNNGPMGLTVNQLAIMDYYFVFGGAPPSTADFNVIHQVLNLTVNGLMGGGLNIKVTMSGAANGYVNPHHGGLRLKAKVRAKIGPKARWTPGVFSGLAVNRDDIHLDSDRLDNGTELAAKTVIHEASHKFASTADFGNRGYTKDDDGTFKAAGLTHAEAFNNADSYARFVMMSFLYPS
jgi:hypothetical protein